jgi:hypothetical protein
MISMPGVAMREKEDKQLHHIVRKLHFEDITCHIEFKMSLGSGRSTYQARILPSVLSRKDLISSSAHLCNRSHPWLDHL